MNRRKAVLAQPVGVGCAPFGDMDPGFQRIVADQQGARRVEHAGGVFQRLQHGKLGLGPRGRPAAGQAEHLGRETLLIDAEEHQHGADGDQVGQPQHEAVHVERLWREGEDEGEADDAEQA
jgi:hypothetical protein